MIIAFDPGNGNTKVAVDGKVAVEQSAVSRPQQIGLASIGMKSAAQATSVQIGEHLFGTGHGSWNLGSMLSSRDYTALASIERRALFFGTLSKLLTPGIYTVDQVVIGLPVPLLQDSTQAQPVIDGLRAYKGTHEYTVNGKAYCLEINRLKILAQPVGAYADWLLDETLRPRKGGRQAEVAVCDLGLGTLDLYAICDGKVLPRFVGGDKVGVRRLLEMIGGNGHDLEELDAGLRSGRIRPTSTQLDLWLGEVLSAIEKTWPNLRRFTTVIPTGGGSLVLGDLLKLALISKGAAVHWADNQVTSNVLGLWKWGSYVSNSAPLER